MKTHKDLDVWKDSVKFVTFIYDVTSKYNKIEEFGLKSQIRRAAVSIPSNIAEGSGRNYSKEFIQFLYIALGSLSELETQFIISKNLNYIDYNILEKIETKIIKIRAQLTGLIKYLKQKK